MIQAMNGRSSHPAPSRRARELGLGFARETRCNPRAREPDLAGRGVNRGAGGLPALG